MLAKTDEKEATKIYRNLVWIAVNRYRLNVEEAHDVASFGILQALEYETFNLNYAARCMVNEIILRGRRGRRERELTYTDDGEVVEYLTFATPARQVKTLTASDCVKAMELLPPSIGPVMQMVAHEYDPPEIAAVLGLKLSSTERAITAGRKILRDRDLYETQPKAGHHAFIGIKRAGRRWKAYVNKEGQRYFAGSYATASQAAEAYDKLAKEILGKDAKLNFPSRAHS